MGKYKLLINCIYIIYRYDCTHIMIFICKLWLFDGDAYIIFKYVYLVTVPRILCVCVYIGSDEIILYFPIICRDVIRRRWNIRPYIYIQYTYDVYNFIELIAFRFDVFVCTYSNLTSDVRNSSACCICWGFN